MGALAHIPVPKVSRCLAISGLGVPADSLQLAVPLWFMQSPMSHGQQRRPLPPPVWRQQPSCRLTNDVNNATISTIGCWPPPPPPPVWMTHDCDRLGDPDADDQHREHSHDHDESDKMHMNMHGQVTMTMFPCQHGKDDDDAMCMINVTATRRHRRLHASTTKTMNGSKSTPGQWRPAPAPAGVRRRCLLLYNNGDGDDDNNASTMKTTVPTVRRRWGHAYGNCHGKTTMMAAHPCQRDEDNAPCMANAAMTTSMSMSPHQHGEDGDHD